MRQPVSKNLVQLQREAKHRDAVGEPDYKHPGVRPKTRGDCINMPRPCPFVGCRYNLYLDVADRGSIKFNFGDDINALNEMKMTCALDVADKGDTHLQGLGDLLNITRERARQLEEIALGKVQRRGAMDFYDDHEEIIELD